MLAGYCLGGTMALAAASRADVAAVVTIAAPWHFAGFPESARQGLDALWRQAEPAVDALGLMPMELLQTSFWRLDPARTIAKFERFGRLAPDSDAARSFVALEDWANGGAPLAFAAGEEMFELLFRADRSGSGRWWIGGTRILPRRLPCPAIEFISATDRIVPAATAAGLPERRVLQMGHVGMVVGGRARTELWEPLRDWLIAAVHPR